MPLNKQLALTQKFNKHCATIRAKKKIAQSQFKCAHTLNVYAFTGILIECFNRLAPFDPLSIETNSKNGVNYFLNSKGYGLQSYREAEGGVRGDAYRDYLILLLPNKIIVSCDITEDSYQPEIIFMLIGIDQDEVDKMEKVLTALIEKVIQKKTPSVS